MFGWLNSIVTEALRTGFFEYQALRDTYREVTMGHMDRRLIKKFIETQAIILSPICPHVAEHVWTLLGNTGSILHSKWPVVFEIDHVLISAGKYINDTAHDFRLRLKAYLTAMSTKGGKKATSEPVVKPTHGTIWIAKEYPPWQSIIMTLLTERFQVCRSYNIS